MSYSLEFKTSALKEWRKLAPPIRAQFRKKLAERLVAPHVPAARLSGSAPRYKIKLRTAGYRLVYEVRESALVVVVIAVGRRDRGSVYRRASER